jgi:ATP-binding cassette subfamily F protein 3
MLLLSCSNLERGFDEGPLFEEIGFEIFSGERVGLVGPNGAGKTTLLRLLAGLDRPDDGEIRFHAGASAILLQQQPDVTPGRSLFEEARTALDTLVAAHDDLVHTAEALANATNENDRHALAERYDRLNEHLRHHDAYNLDHRIEKVLGGLGFSENDYCRAVDTFSGGQQSRLMLAKLLLSAPDVMLLDEPSNHLDISATQWLEDYLSRQSEAMLIVSHDRYFLDKVVGKVFELNDGHLTVYPGNYRAYASLRQERYALELKAFEAQQEYIARQEEYIRRVHYGQLHKQAQSRRKALDRLERVERPTLVDSPHMHFGEVRRSGDVVVQVDDISKSYDRPLFAGFSFTLERGRRLGILGPNGCGKTTLLRVLMGEEEPDTGTVQRGALVQFGYYDQHLRSLPADKPVYQAVWPMDDPEYTEQRIRDLLGRFGLVGHQVYQTVENLSGGERSRAALARLVALGVNVLVLDEPTNHLDLWACEALEKALLDFNGTVIVVSHDRYFLNRVVDQMIVFEGNGQVQVVFGNYDTYEQMRAQQDANSPAAVKPDAPMSGAAPMKDTSSSLGRRPRRKFPYRKVEELECEISEAEARLKELERRLASPDLYRDGDQVKETTRAFDEITQLLARLYEHWEESVELN